MEYIIIFWLCEVEFVSEGKYQCVIFNYFGLFYFVKVKFIVNMFFLFIKIFMDFII